MKLLCLLNLVLAFAQSPTPLEQLAGETQVAATRASASAADARSAVHEVHARLAAEAAARSRRATEAVASNVAQTSLKMKGAAVEAQKAQAGVSAAAAEAKEVMDGAHAAMLKAEAAAAAHVTEQVEGRLAGAYKSHEEWKMKVIHDPAKEAAKAGMKAALPYEKALQTIEKRVGDYESRASGLSNEARSLRVQAVGVADNAVEQQAAGAVKAAQQNMMNAHSMMNQATHFEAQGHALMNEAQKWNQQIPTYVGAAAGAAHKMTQQFAKNLYAPPPPAMAPTLLIDVAAHDNDVKGRALLKSLSAAKPIGEGADQSGKAVRQRTTDKNTHCEDEKWDDCYSHDYIDKRGSPPKPAAALKKSGAAQLPVVAGMIMAIVAALA